MQIIYSTLGLCFLASSIVSSMASLNAASDADVGVTFNSLIPKAHHEEPKLHCVSAFGNDELVIVGSGLITFPYKLVRKGFERPPYNTTFTIPKSGVYQINVQIHGMSIDGASNTSLSVLVDGKVTVGMSYMLNIDQLIGGSELPLTTLIRMFPLLKGQTISVLLTNPEGGTFTIRAAQSPPFDHLSNRAISISLLD